MEKKPNKNKDLAIDYNLEPYHRRWSGGTLHTHHNKICGPFTLSKKEWNRMIEERNRINKQRKQKQKTGK